MSRKLRRGAAAVITVALAAALCACGSSSTKTSSAASAAASSTSSGGSQSAGGSKHKVYQVYLSLNFAGNAFRQQFFKTMQLATQTGALAGRVKLTIVNAGSSVADQAQGINNIAQRKPDILTVLPASASGLDAAIQRACAAGVTVVAFDSIVNAPCAYNIGVDFFNNAKKLGTWLAAQNKGKSGTILVDQGIPGVPAADAMYNGYVAGIKAANPHLTTVGYPGELAPGPSKAAVANLLPAHKSDLLGVATISFVSAVQSALKQANAPAVPMTALTATNGDMQVCLKAGQKCLFGATPATEGAEAMKLGVDILDGTASKSVKKVVLPATWYTSNVAPGIPGVPSVKTNAMVLNKNVFPKLAPSFSEPWNAAWLPLTAQAVAG